MKSACWLFLSLISVTIPAFADTLSATYVGTPNGRLGFAAAERFTMTVGAKTLHVREEPIRWQARAIWWQVEFETDERSLTVRGYGWPVPLEHPTFGDPVLHRYQFRAGDDPPLEYVNEQTGKALLPKFGFQGYFLPKPSPGASIDETGFPRSCYLLGHAFYLEKVEEAEPVGAWRDAKKLEFDSTLLVGTSRNFRDGKLGRIEGPEDYEYVRFVEPEYDDMIEAGINYVIVDAEQQEWVRHRPLFYVSRTPQFPEEFYRSNYHGWLYIMDEPAVLLYEDRQVGDLVKDVRDVSTTMRARARAEYSRLNELADLPRFEQPRRIGDADTDPLRIIQEDVPYWDTINSAAYYELAEGGSGAIHEGRYNLDADQHMMGVLFGEGIDLATDEMFLIQYAFLRGAARNFGKMWGTSIYGQADPAVSPRAFEIAYDMGARWLWFWTSDHGHHLPYPEQIALAEHLRDYAAENPRPPHSELIRAATTVIALPDGYVLDPFVLWKFPRLSLDNPNHTGATHKDVLRRALAEAIMCIRRGEKFDFAVDTYDFNPEGYERVVRVQFDGTAVETGPVERKFRTTGAPPGIKMEASPLSAPDLPGRSDPSETSDSPDQPDTGERTLDRPVLHARFVGNDPPEIDGDLSDWADARWYQLTPDPIGSDMIHGATDLVGEVAFAYDADNLYLALRITDELHAQPFSDWLLWNGDCVQVGLDPLLDSGEEGYGPVDSEFGFTFHEDGEPETWWWVSPEKTGKREGIEITPVRKEGETIYEVRVASSLIEPWSPRLTRRSGINVAIADADAEALADVGAGALGRRGRESALEITDSLIYRKRPDLFAILELEPGPEAPRQTGPSCFLARGRAANQAGKPVDLVLYSWAAKNTSLSVSFLLKGSSGVMTADGSLSIPAGHGRQRISVAPSGIPPGLYTLEAAVRHRGGAVAGRRMDVFFW